VDDAREAREAKEEMKSRRKEAEYHEGPEAATQFRRVLSGLLSVSRDELRQREAAHEELKRDKPRRGPQPKQRT
jgi:hypothetical protein